MFSLLVFMSYWVCQSSKSTFVPLFSYELLSLKFLACHVEIAGYVHTIGWAVISFGDGNRILELLSDFKSHEYGLSESFRVLLKIGIILL